MDPSKDSTLAPRVLLETLEGEADFSQTLTNQLESNLLLRLQVEDLQKTLEEKENQLTQAQETIRILRDEVLSLQNQLDCAERKYQGLLDQQPQALLFIQPNSEDKSMVCKDPPSAGLPCRTEASSRNPRRACADQQPTFMLSFESEPDPTDPSGQRSSSAALSCTSEHAPSPPTHQSNTHDAVEGDQLITATNGKVDQQRPQETHQTSPSDFCSNTEKPSELLTLKVVSVRLDDYRHKLAPNGVFFVQGQGDEHDVDDNEDNGGGDADHTTECHSDTEAGPSPPASKKKKEFIQKRAWECTQCNKRFSQSNHLKLHQRSHRKILQDQPSETHSHKCGTCGKTFPYRSFLLIHERVHTKEKPYACIHCGQTFSQMGNLKIHYSKQHETLPLGDAGTPAVAEEDTPSSTLIPGDGYKCEDCGKAFLYRSLLRLHQRTHTGERPHACSACGKGFSILGNLQTHMQRHKHKLHVQPRRPHCHKCGTCGKRFSHRSALLIHERVHTGEKPYACTVCGRRFSQLGNLKAHRSKHQEKSPLGDASTKVVAEDRSSSTRFPEDAGVDADSVVLAMGVSRTKPHECAQCGKAFSFRAQLRAHRRKHTGEKPYSCNVCKKAFGQRSSLQVHQLLHHNKDGRRRGYGCDKCGKKLHSQSALLIHQRTHSKEKRRRCTLCERRFSSPDSLRNHERRHAKDLRHQCSHCGKVFVTPSKLQQHLRKHTGEKPFSCHQCSKSFTSSSGLKKHSQIHTGEMPYRCFTCGKAFKFQSNLRAHERTHTQERPYLCHLCGKTFSDGSSLSRHHKTHSGERPHTCPHCNRKFLNATNLRRHLLRHTGQRPHLCAVCGKAFSRPEILKTHQRIHTGERPYQCNVCGERFAYPQSLQSHQKREHLACARPKNSGRQCPQGVESC